MVFVWKTNFYLGKSWFWRTEPTFAWEKDGFGVKKQLFPRKKIAKFFLGLKKMVSGRKINFFLGKTKKKPSFCTLAA